MTAPSLIIAKTIPADLPLPGQPSTASPAQPNGPLIVPQAPRLIIPGGLAVGDAKTSSGLILPGGFQSVRQPGQLVIPAAGQGSLSVVGHAADASLQATKKFGPAAAQILGSKELDIARRAEAQIRHDRLIALLRAGQLSQAVILAS